MFEEWIAQGESMVERLRFEESLPQADAEQLPAAKRVSHVECGIWKGRVQSRIAEHYGPDTLQRLADLKQITSDEIQRRVGTATSQVINDLERIINLMSELERR